MVLHLQLHWLEGDFRWDHPRRSRFEREGTRSLTHKADLYERSEKWQHDALIGLDIQLEFCKPIAYSWKERMQIKKRQLAQLFSFVASTTWNNYVIKENQASEGKNWWCHELQWGWKQKKRGVTSLNQLNCFFSQQTWKFILRYNKRTSVPVNSIILVVLVVDFALHCTALVYKQQGTCPLKRLITPQSVARMAESQELRLRSFCSQ